MPRSRGALRLAATVELASLLVLLTNLATVHLPAIASLMGPLHGCAYVVVIGAVIRDPHRSRGAVALAFVPGIGGLLALHRLSGASRMCDSGA